MVVNWFHPRLLFEGAVFCLLMWKYRKNRLIAFGGALLALVGTILLASKLGFPDWLSGVFVLAFLVASIVFVLLAGFLASKFVYLRLRKSSTSR